MEEFVLGQDLTIRSTESSLFFFGIVGENKAECQYLVRIKDCDTIFWMST